VFACLQEAGKTQRTDQIAKHYAKQKWGKRKVKNTFKCAGEPDKGIPISRGTNSDDATK